jgi:hypothetical protein
MSAENRDSGEDMQAISPRRVSDLSFLWEFYPESKIENWLCLRITYYPLTQNTEGIYSNIEQLYGNLSLDWGAKLPLEIKQKLDTLERVIAPLLPSYEVNMTGSTPLIVKPIIREIFCHCLTKPPTEIPNQLSVIYYYKTQPDKKTQINLQWNSLSRSQQLVVSNVSSWVKKQAWEDLAKRIREISGQPAEAARGHKVFLSYKKQSRAEKVAETIAHRLSQQNIEVWFDKWEIKAGDSVPGKIGEGFKNSDACLIFLESQYSSSDWCTKEMNTALAKAISEGLNIIPILVEDCEKPELLKDLKHISLREPSAAEFEQKLAEITDAIYKVDLNPYR